MKKMLSKQATQEELTSPCNYKWNNKTRELSINVGKGKLIKEIK
jgi:hypothetical protein